MKEYIFGKDITFRLSAEKLGLVEEFYETDFGRVRFRLGGLIPKVLPWDYAAIVFYNTINYNEGCEWLLNDDLTLAEELWHVVQWRKHNCVMLPAKYLIELYRNKYSGNSFEIEAKQMAQDFLKYHKSNS